MTASVPRVGAVASLNQLPDPENFLTRLAAQVLRAPMAVMTVLDHGSSRWVATAGLTASAMSGVQHTPMVGSFCQYVLTDEATTFSVDDATSHARTKDNPTVALLGARGWAGAAIRDGHARVLGSVCVIDVVPREWTASDLELLEALAAAAAAQMSLLTAAAGRQLARDDLEALQDSERRAQQRLERLTNVALELAGAQSVADVIGIIVCRGLPVLGADSGALVVIDGSEPLHVISATCDDGSAAVHSGVADPRELLPGPHVCRTGRPMLLTDRAAALDFSPQTAALFAATGRHAVAVVPMRVGTRLLGALEASWPTKHVFTPAEAELLQAFAAQCGQALDRIHASDDRHAAALQVQRLSEALQRSLLAQPPTSGVLDIAVRYLPAAQEAQVGGDWYDAFTTHDGDTLLSVGDVAGHDRNAAAVMAQLRNLLRGLAVDTGDGPALLLTRLDRAMDLLGLDTFATAFVARVDTGDPATASGLRVRWSSAGHLPPLLRQPDGTVQPLTQDADLLLGFDPSTDRVEHLTLLPAGSSLLMYTDGLVERRGESLDDGLLRLTRALEAAGGASPEQTCDLLLQVMLPDAPEDDVALLLLQARTAPLR